MAQEYTIKEWKPWIDNNTGEVVKDNHGNIKGTAIFNEFSSEPVDATFKPPVQVGQKKYGEIGEYTTKAGKTRIGFTRKDRPADGSGGSKYDGDGQKQGMAIKSAAEFVTKWADKRLSPSEFAQAVKPYALVLYQMELKADGVEAKEQPQATSGYEKAKEVREKLPEPEFSDKDVPDFDFDVNEPINLDNIPF